MVDKPPKGDIEVGSVFQGRFEVHSVLGEGGFGQVFKATQLATGQLVAIKVIRPPQDASVDMEKMKARFLREMSLCAQLHHPNIVRLIDSGETADGRLYIVFSFVPGEDLYSLLARDGALEPVEAVYLMGQVLDALAAAHRVGVVHRDLKPANIMVSTTGARRNATVLDFGIGAITVHPGQRELSQITGTDELVGTPHYAAPEQLRGKPPTPRADLYAWGLVFLECLTGEFVMSGGSLTDIIYRQLGPEPIPISRALRRHPLGRILERVTAKDPNRRDVTAEGLLRALDRCDCSGLTAADIRRSRHDAVVTADFGPPDSPTVAETAAGVSHGAPLPVGELDTDVLHRNSAPASAWRPDDAERRQLTALGCSLSVVGRDDESVDLDDYDSVLRLLQDLCREVATRHGGHVADMIGDRVLLYFGYPTAEESDPRRAVQAASELLAEVEQLSPTPSGARPEVRVGVHTGLVITRVRPDNAQRARDIVGVTPKVAAQLGMLAAPGTAWVSEQTRALVKRHFRFVSEGSRRISGLGKPVEIFRLSAAVVAPQTLSTLFGADTVPFVGRGREMGTLADHWQLTAEGEGQVVLITGEPGIGKSRLVREFVRRVAKDGEIWLECRCVQENRHAPLHPFVDLLGRLAGLPPRAEVGERLDRLEELLSEHELDLAENVPLFAPLFGVPEEAGYETLDISPQKKRQLTHEAIASLLFEMAEEGPLLLVVEDLHWADPSTVELLGLLVEEAAGGPMLVLGTSRPSFSPPWPDTRLQRLQLGKLPRAQVREMVLGITRGRPVPDEVLAEIVKRTDGVSLFVEELTQMLISSDVLALRDDRYELTRPLAEVAIPSSLRDLLAAHLDRLGEAKETAQLAAAIGREFDLELLGAISPLSDAGLNEDLRTLMAADLVLHRRRRRSTPLYLFKHALVRDMAYDSLVRQSRQQIHADIARTLEERFPEQVEARPDLLAQHHAAAGQMPQALDYAIKAGFAALQRSTYAEAVGHAEQAKGWLAQVSDATMRAQLELALNGVLTPALMASRGMGDPAIRATVERSEELMKVVGESPENAPMLWALMQYYVMVDDVENTAALVDRLLPMAEAVGDSGLKVATLASKGSNGLTLGDFEEARACWEEAIALYDAEHHLPNAVRYGTDTLVMCRSHIGFLLTHLGLYDQAQEQHAAAEAWAREIKHANSLGLALLFRTMSETMVHDKEAALATVGQVMQVSERHGLYQWMAYGASIMGWATGQLEMTRNAIEGLEARGFEVGLPWHRSLMASLEAESGNFLRGQELAEQCLERMERLGERQSRSRILTMIADYRLRRDPEAEAEAAEKLLREALEVAREQGTRLFELEAATVLARHWQSRDQAAEAKGLLQPVVDGFAEGRSIAPFKAAQELLQQLG